MERTQIHLPVAMKRSAQEIAERRGLSLAAFIRLLIGYEVETQERKDREFDDRGETAWDAALTP